MMQSTQACNRCMGELRVGFPEVWVYFQLNGSDNYLLEREMLYSPPYQYGFADSSHSLAGCWSGEVYGQVGQAQDGHKGQQTLLIHKFLAMVICSIIAEDRFHKFHLGRKKNDRKRGKKRIRLFTVPETAEILHQGYGKYNYFLIQ